MKSTDSYLMAGRNMKVFPVAVSMYVSWFSAISFLADPVEVYYGGIIYWLYIIAYIFSFIVIGRYFAPAYNKAHLTSGYEVSAIILNYLNIL